MWNLHLQYLNLRFLNMRTLHLWWNHLSCLTTRGSSCSNFCNRIPPHHIQAIFRRLCCIVSLSFLCYCFPCCPQFDLLSKPRWIVNPMTADRDKKSHSVGPAPTIIHLQRGVVLSKKLWTISFTWIIVEGEQGAQVKLKASQRARKCMIRLNLMLNEECGRFR